MITIAFPLRPGQQGPSIADLQKLLLELLRQGVLKAPGKSSETMAALGEELAQLRYGATTAALVRTVQQVHALPDHGEVDQRTAAKLSDLAARLAGPAAAPSISAGARGGAVHELQILLEDLGYPIHASEVDGHRFGATTAQALREWQRQHDEQPTAVADLRSLRQLRAQARELLRTVRGTVLLATGKAAANLHIEAHDRAFRRSRLLGSALTDSDGHYRITYATRALPDENRALADIGIAVFGSDAAAPPLQETSVDAIVLHAALDCVIDVRLARVDAAGLPEFDAIARRLADYLGADEAERITEAAEASAFHLLARQTGVDAQSLARYVVARRVQALGDVPGEYVFALLCEEGLWGLGSGRQRALQRAVDTDSDTRAVLYESVLLDAAVAESALQRAVQAYRISAALLPQAASLHARLQRLRDEAQAYADAAVPQLVFDWVANLIAEDQHPKAAEAFRAARADGFGEWFARLDTLGVIAGAQRESVQARLQLGELLDFNGGLLHQIASQAGADTPASLRALARLQRSDWTERLRDAGGMDATTARRQSSIVVRRFEQAFPTIAFSAQLVRHKPAAITAYAEVATLLDAHPDFELGGHAIAAYLRQSGTDSAGIAPAVLDELERVQRVFRLSGGSYGKTVGLLQAGYGSAAEVAAAGRSRFVADAQRSGVDAPEAQRIFELSERTQLAALVVAANLRTLSWPRALEGDDAPTLARQIERIVAEQPDLRSLFGSNDVCECGHCNSIYGPAAYFVDVMRFLRQRRVIDTTRPDDAAIGTALQAMRDGLGGTTTPEQRFVLAKEQVATLLAITQDMAAGLLVEVHLPDGSGVRSLASLLTEGVIADGSVPLHPATTPQLYLAVRAARRAADRKLGLTVNAKDLLFSRCPELGDIDLSCANAETEVPHIDLVCERLEQAVAPDPGFAYDGPVSAGAAPAALLAAVRGAGIDIGDKALIYGPYASGRFMLRNAAATVAIDAAGSGWTGRQLRQTHGTAAERAAAPEYVNRRAYELLAQAKTAFALPFDLFHSETRGLLQAAEVERADLMQILAKASLPSPQAIAAERLGLSSAGAELIFSANLAGQAAIWAVPPPLVAATGADLCAVDQAGQPLQPLGLQSLDLFARRSGLEFAQIEQLLSGRYVRGSADPYIRHCDNGCDLARKVIVSLDLPMLDRIHRVLRLARKTGIAPRDIDRLAAAPRLGQNDLGDAALLALAQLHVVARTLKIGVDRLITWLDLITQDGSPSEHAQLLQNPAAGGAPNPALTPQAIRKNEADEAATPGSGQRLAAFAGDLAQAFGLTGAMWNAVYARLCDSSLFGPNPPLTLRILAALNARCGLTQVLQLGMADLVAIERLRGIDPLASATALADFVRAADQIRASGQTLAELEHRLARRGNDLEAKDLAHAAITPALQLLRGQLLAAKNEHRSRFDATLGAEEQLGALQELLQRQAQLGAAAVADVLELLRQAVPSASLVLAVKTMVSTSAELPAPHGGLKGRVDEAAVAGAIDTLAATPDEMQRLALIDLLMGGLAAWAYRLAARQAASASVAALLRIPTETAEVLVFGRAPLWRGARLPGTPAQALSALLTSGAIAETSSALSPTTTPDLYRGLRLLHAIAGFVAPYQTDAANIAFLLEQAAALGWTTLDSIPFEGSAQLGWIAWRQLADAFDIFSTYPDVSMPGYPGQAVSVGGLWLLTLDSATSKADLLKLLALLTGWPREALEALDTHFALSLSDYRRAATWQRLQQGVQMLQRLRLPLSEALAFIIPTLGEPERRAARRMLRSHYAQSDWLGVLKNLMDPLRERKRDALVAFLLAQNPALRSTADLYDVFLTDTQWSAKMPSSRLVHAHGTVQLFVQRCIAGLEPQSTADLDGDQDWRWWTWMKNYRVWEVNRKVFVEPQYYLRPEWRDDKTELFDEFESELLQNELNDDTIAAAFEGYLDRLDQIAFLDVLSTCYDQELDDLHVFAATKGGDPQLYFHRVFQRGRVWTPWKKIDLDIAGRNLIGFFRNRRLCLGWITFTEKGDDQQKTKFPVQSGTGVQDLPQAKRRMEVRLAVSEYTGQHWLPRRQSQGFLLTKWADASFDPQLLFLATNTNPADFAIELYLAESASDGPFYAVQILGRFRLSGCKGYPEADGSNAYTYTYIAPAFWGTQLLGQKAWELDWAHDKVTFMYAGRNQDLLHRTPGNYRITYPFQRSITDALLTGPARSATAARWFGTFMPFFFEDNTRGFMLTPALTDAPRPSVAKRRMLRYAELRRTLQTVASGAARYAEQLALPAPDAGTALLDQLSRDSEFAQAHAQLKSLTLAQSQLQVRNFYHPMSCRLRERFFQGGVPLLLARATQLEVGTFRFEDRVNGYAPDAVVLPPFPREELDFGRDGAYSVYNWELTFHIPHLVAAKLIEAGQFDAAETWLRYIFDPLGSSNDPAPQRYWNTKPFYLRSPAEYGQQLIASVFERLAKDPDGSNELELADAVLEWRRNPFKPYLVARGRTVAFQQAIVDLTIRLFIGRGDQHFRRDQLEHQLLASLDYSRAERLLGPRPRRVPAAVQPPPETYNQLEPKLDLFGNALRTLENLVPDLSALPHGGAELPPPPLNLESLYFCIPPGDKLYELWDLLEERQFNLRNSRTIDGVERTLSLFAPPLSVEELIRATAAGLSASSVLAGMGAPRPPYRFRMLLRHALELADVAAGFSRDLQQALAAGDGEGLARLKAEQELRLLAEQTAALKAEIELAARSVESAQKLRSIHQETHAFYTGRPYMNAWEIAANVSYGLSFALQAVVAIGYAASGGLALVPSFTIGAAGFGGTPTAHAETGGKDYSSSARDFVVGAIGALSAALDKAGGMLERQGNYLVRKQDWDHSAANAQREAERADIEIAIAGIRESIATEQYRVHGVRRQQMAAEESYLRSKFSSRELYQWQAQALRALSRTMYNLAFEAAKAAERCFNFELGLSESYVRAGQWIDTRAGLHAADALRSDLYRLQNDHYKRHTREREVTAHISLARLDPIALVELRGSGRCEIQLPEAVFDLEHPGHYFRRIKALSVSVPGVIGPYVGVGLKLTQVSNRLRVETTRRTGGGSDAQQYEEAPGGDSRFRYNVGGIESLETSHGDDDAGLFNLDLDDARYLPLEGSGVCGTYVLELPQALRSFDYGSIADVVLKLRYTARDGGGGFRRLVEGGLRERLNSMALKAGRAGLFQAIDLRRDRPDLWHQLRSTGSASLTIAKQDLPYFTQARAVSITASRALARVAGAPSSYAMTLGTNTVTLGKATETGLAGLLSSSAFAISLDAPLNLVAPLPSKLEELVLIVNYSMTA